MNRDNLLLVANSEQDANMLYAVGMFVPDPFIFFSVGGKPHIVLNDLEIDRGRREARRCRVLPLSRYFNQLRQQGNAAPTLAQALPLILRRFRLRRVVVPSSFPLALARQLQKAKIKVDIRPGSFFPAREIKTAEEVKKISAALVMAEVGLSEAMQVLRRAKIGKGGKLIYQNGPLTSERLRSVIDVAILQAGGLASNTIVAGGAQACDPHERGFGALRANQPIVLDVFPRSQKTGYFGDITRTVVRGRATEAVRKLYATVARGQQLAFEKIRSGARALEIHQTVQKFFEGRGYKTGKQKGRMAGFFHGTGHGLGLEIHEPPRVGVSSTDTLKKGQIVTVEPGLYYHGMGGVRIEDVVLVTAEGVRNLTRFEKVLEL